MTNYFSATFTQNDTCNSIFCLVQSRSLWVSAYGIGSQSVILWKFLCLNNPSPQTGRTSKDLFLCTTIAVLSSFDNLQMIGGALANVELLETFRARELRPQRETRKVNSSI